MLQQLLELIDPNPRLVLLQAQILQSAGDADDALETLAEGVREFDDNRNLRLTFARLLIQNERYQLAQAQFAAMMAQDPQDWETLFSMALLDVELEQFDQASDKFTQLAEVDPRADEANYYLAVNDQRFLRQLVLKYEPSALMFGHLHRLETFFLCLEGRRDRNPRLGSEGLR